MAIRAAAFGRVGRFDESLSDRGDEEEWLRRHEALGGRVRYLAAAGLHHRRAPSDATLRRMSRAAWALGRSARRHDVRIGEPKPLAAELRVLGGCAWHAVARRCGYGVVMFAHAAGRVYEFTRERGSSAAGVAGADDDFLSGTAGEVSGRRAVVRATVEDGLADAVNWAIGVPWRLRRAAACAPRRRVLVLGVERTDAPT